MLITQQLRIKDVKKHSVRYDAVGAEPAVTAIYISKRDLEEPWPNEIIITIEEARD